MRFARYLLPMLLVSATAQAGVPLWGRFDFYDCASREDCRFVKSENIDIELQMQREPPGELHGFGSFSARFAGEKYLAEVDLYIAGGWNGDADISTSLAINPGRPGGISYNLGHASVTPLSSLRSISFPEHYSKNGRKMVRFNLGYGKSP